MKILKQWRLVTTLGLIGLTLTVVGSPRPVSAQCSMMGSGGHDHGTSKNPDAKTSASEKKQRESISRLLSDEQGRRVLAETLLEDRAFTMDFIGRLLNSSEWRPLVSEEVTQPSRAKGLADSTDGQRAVAYVCPMHPEVTSTQPSRCPKCGMALVTTMPNQDR